MNDSDHLRNLIQRYARGADTRDLDLLRQLFHPDAVLDGVRGKMSLDQWLETMAGPSPFASSMHLMADPLIEIDADGQTARLDTYAVVFANGDPDKGQAHTTLGMRYLDRAVRADSGWVIAERVSRSVWHR